MTIYQIKGVNMFKVFFCSTRAAAHRSWFRCFHASGSSLDISKAHHHQGVRITKYILPNRRKFHESAGPQKNDPSKKKPLHKAVNIQQLTLICPQDVTQRTVIRCLGDGVSKEHELEEHRSQAIVILATSRFVKWLENDGDFIQNLLKKFVPLKSDLIELDLVCGCVDGLSPQTEDILNERDKPPREGFSVLYDPSYVYLQDPWSERVASKLDSTFGAQSSLLFDYGIPEHKQRFDITVPLANTLFKNGKVSTLLVSKWRLWGNGTITIAREPVQIDQVAMDFQTSDVVPRLYTPAVPLTMPREIVDGLGNIVRTLRFNSGVGPASRELEEAVNSYISKSQQGPIDVWALITPQCIVPPLTHERPLFPGASAGHALQMDDLTQLDDAYIGEWLEKGARFCRVLSGGGGWGKKQGLLSLDPQTHYNVVSESRFDFSSESMTEQQVSALGNIAQAGSFVQFFFARKPESPLLENTMVNHKALHHVRHKCTVIGTTPSTADEIPKDDSPSSSEGGDSLGVIVLHGHFGCVTESGLFLNRDTYKAQSHEWQEGSIPRCTTKIDMPYSYFYSDWRCKDQQSILHGVSKDTYELQKVRAD